MVKSKEIQMLQGIQRVEGSAILYKMLTIMRDLLVRHLNVYLKKPKTKK